MQKAVQVKDTIREVKELSEGFSRPTNADTEVEQAVSSMSLECDDVPASIRQQDGNDTEEDLEQLDFSAEAASQEEVSTSVSGARWQDDLLKTLLKAHFRQMSITS